MELNYHSIEALLNAAKENNCRLSQLVLTQQAEQMELPEQEIYEKMRQNYQVMASCIQPGSAPDLKSTSGLTGGDAYRMRTAVEQGKNRPSSWRRSLPCPCSIGIKCFHGKNRGGAYSRKLRNRAGSSADHAGAVQAYREGMRHVPFYCIRSGNGNRQ